ncbi:uncharacterized protein BYT42DRAFT_611018 [Radiomyces spectabilis]|uniref:uncharacterized protein n=1 Tax=Radiomyces spectabilis TaxID=64574 RepID=UPI00221F5B83|nr:uncharacterized protein BYT42DRAFT_611018 [Radiomyces spectabilis]KAI8391837.1 hypothetical protein BYT42DRAFT_611018 [Radiomyces spectabilis]
MRLVVIDYAGLSTNPNDVGDFLKAYPQIKELVVDHGLAFELFTCNELINNQERLAKFNCCTGPKHRSLL